MDGMGIYIIGSAARTPFVTRYKDALKGSSVGVYMLGLWRMACCVNVIESSVGLRKSSSVNSIQDSLTPFCAILGKAT